MLSGSALGDSGDVQVFQPLRYSGALIALGLGDRAGARENIAAGLAAGPATWGSRYAWPLLWLGMNIEAEEATLARDRREDVPVTSAQRVGELAAMAESLSAPTPATRGYQALAAAERARAAGTDGPGGWAAAVTAWRSAGEPNPLAYDGRASPGTS